MRTSSNPSPILASPMLSVDTRSLVSRYERSHSSIASHRSSSGVRFHLSHLRHTTQSRPFAPSKASRRPTGKCSIASLAPRSDLQNRQVEYMGSDQRQLTDHANLFPVM